MYSLETGEAPEFPVFLASSIFLSIGSFPAAHIHAEFVYLLKIASPDPISPLTCAHFFSPFHSKIPWKNCLYLLSPIPSLSFSCELTLIMLLPPLLTYTALVRVASLLQVAKSSVQFSVFLFLDLSAVPAKGAHYLLLKCFLYLASTAPLPPSFLFTSRLFFCFLCLSWQPLNFRAPQGAWSSWPGSSLFCLYSLSQWSCPVSGLSIAFLWWWLPSFDP